MPDKKYIRFINSDYKTLFHLPDGGRIRLTHSDGEQQDRVCRFIDEYHTEVGNWTYHICEFAERMEQNGTRYEPLDYIRDVEFYPKHFFALDDVSRGPAYYIIDETAAYGFAFTPAGAAKGMKYCVFELIPDGCRSRPGEVVMWGGSLQEIRPQDWGLDLTKIKGITQKPKARPTHRH